MASLGGEVVSDCRRSDDGKPEVIHPDEKKSKFGQRLIAWLHVRNRFSRLQEPSVPRQRLFTSCCSLLPPREIAKLS
jgi:hypothetical protein